MCEFVGTCLPNVAGDPEVCEAIAKRFALETTSGRPATSECDLLIGSALFVWKTMQRLSATYWSAMLGSTMSFSEICELNANRRHCGACLLRATGVLTCLTARSGTCVS